LKLISACQFGSSGTGGGIGILGLMFLGLVTSTTGIGLDINLLK
jgi:hypothetical protein